MGKRKCLKGEPQNVQVPISATQQPKGIVSFQHPAIARLSACAFGALKFVSADTKTMLQKRGCWDDVVQAVYCAVIEYWRVFGHQPRDFDTNYKDFMNHINRTVYAAIRDLIPEHKRDRFEISVPNRVLNQARNFKEIEGIPICRERNICRAIEAGVYGNAMSISF